MDTKQTKNYGTTYFALAFIVAVLFELYFIMTNPYNYFMLIGIGIIMLITGYLTFDSIAKSKADAANRLAEQNDMMLKASKAIYLATKRSSQEAQNQHIQNIKAIEYFMNNMISNEKDMVNLMIAKNEEIVAKQITTKTEADDMSSLIEQLSASNAKLAKEVQSVITVNELVKANADLVKNVREVLHGNQSSLNTDNISEYISDAVGDILNDSEQADKMTPISDSSNTNTSYDIPGQNVSVGQEQSQTIMNDQTDITNTDIDFDNISDNFNVNTLDDVSEDFSINTLDDLSEDFSTEDIVINEFSSTEDTAVSDISVPMEQEPDEFDFESFELPELDSNVHIEESEAATSQEIIDDVNISTLNDMVSVEGDTIVPEISEELDKEMSEEPSDNVTSELEEIPNRQLTEEEIAALFANL
ncbi:MAG: hypothetical protein K2M73_04005 [Lachnospiraceae bacterium]|nr:hypothetical protein [Lachnospiraceae bacterium]